MFYAVSSSFLPDFCEEYAFLWQFSLKNVMVQLCIRAQNCTYNYANVISFLSSRLEVVKKTMRIWSRFRAKVILSQKYDSRKIAKSRKISFLKKNIHQKFH